MPTPEEWMRVVGDARVSLRYAHDRSRYAEGRILSYSIGPMVLIETDEGERIWWRSSLAEIEHLTAYKGKP